MWQAFSMSTLIIQTRHWAPEGQHCLEVLPTLYVTEANGELAEFGYLPEYLLSDEVHAPVLGPQVDFLLEPGVADLYALMRRCHDDGSAPSRVVVVFTVCASSSPPRTSTTHTHLPRAHYHRTPAPSPANKLARVTHTFLAPRSVVAVAADRPSFSQPVAQSRWKLGVVGEPRPTHHRGLSLVYIPLSVWLCLPLSWPPEHASSWARSRSLPPSRVGILLLGHGRQRRAWATDCTHVHTLLQHPRGWGIKHGPAAADALLSLSLSHSLSLSPAPARERPKG